MHYKVKSEKMESFLLKKNISRYFSREKKELVDGMNKEQQKSK